MTLRARVVEILAGHHGNDAERVHEAIDAIAGAVNDVTSRLAVIDPEWEVIARQPFEDQETKR